VSIVSGYNFDFKITVKHDACDNGEDCFESYVSTETNAHASGLKCSVEVQRDGADCSAGFGRFMPCRQWNDFFPRTLPMTDANGNIQSGKYTISYSCNFHLASGASVSSHSKQKLHTFQLHAGCADTIPAGHDSNIHENVARYLLLTADEFNVADCRNEAQVYEAREAIFRRYDNDPPDGVLSYDEIIAALVRHSADTYILSVWRDALGGELELKPSQIMSVETNDMECGSGTVVFTDSVYPSDSPGRLSTTPQCSQEAAAVRTSWRYRDDDALKGGDYVCLYIDGMLYDKEVMTSSDPRRATFTRVGNVYAPTELIDTRPTSGSFEDVQQSLVANFLFDEDEHDAGSIKSTSPPVDGQRGAAPKLSPVDKRRSVGPCTTGAGASCLESVTHPAQNAQYAYEYDAVDFVDDVAISSWIYGRCTNGAGTDVRKMAIAHFSGENGGMKHALRFYLQRRSSTTMNLVLDYTQNGAVKYTLSISNVACGSWEYVGFSLNKLDGMVLFANPTGDVNGATESATYKTYTGMQPDVPRKILKVMQKLEFFGAVDVEFDDVRLYSGQVRRATFLDAFKCGHRPLCAKRAHATPASRRVVCASAVLSSKPVSSYSDYFCTAALYYDGTAIDVAATLALTGVVFTFRDTSWEEGSFEVLRKAVNTAEHTSTSYETIIQMDGDLKGCVNKFSSISHIDREAGAKPGLEWFYKVRTKIATAGVLDFVSTTHYFKAPWLGVLEGVVTAGASTSPVPYVRICADFSLPNGTLLSEKNEDERVNLALYMRAEHTADISKSAAQDTYVVTDGDPSPKRGSSIVRPGEFLRVELAQWSSIDQIKICTVSDDVIPDAYVQDYDSGDTGNHGLACEFDSALTYKESSHSCFSYNCRGTHLKAFHGKYITAAIPSHGGAKAEITEIMALGSRTNCRYSEVTDSDGRYEMSVRETSGLLPVKTQMLVGAYKEETFRPSKAKLVDSSQDPHKILLVLRKNTQGSASGVLYPLSKADLDESGDVSRDEFQSHVENIAGFPINGHAIISDELWNEMDSDKDGTLDTKEYATVSQNMRDEKLVVDVLVVYTIIHAKYLSAFTSLSNVASCERFVLMRQKSAVLPANTTAWNALVRHSKAVDIVAKSQEPCDETSQAVKNIALLKKCGSPEEIHPLKMQMHGTYIAYVGRPKTSTNIIVFGQSKNEYVAAYQDARYCQMVKFSISRDSNGMCRAVADSARYIVGTCDAKPSDYATRWYASYIKIPLADTDTSGGYGISSLTFRSDAVDANGDAKFANILPILGFGPNGKSLSLKNAATKSEEQLFQQFRNDASLMAKEQQHDVVHVFDKNGTSKSDSADDEESLGHLFSSGAKVKVSEIDVRHRGVTEKDFRDDTTVTIRGAILFPTHRTAGSTKCGLDRATIQVKEIDGEGEPEEYTTDESGWFDIAVTRGKSFSINASFPGHSLCFTGHSVEDATDVTSCDGKPHVVTLRRIRDGSYVFFTDVTEANIDLGLYQGQCDRLYAGARFKVTPINGCHPSQYVTTEQISGWMTNLKGITDETFNAENPRPANARVWPYAAMDYSIMFDSGPTDVLDKLDGHIAQKPWFHSCKKEPVSLVDFFVKRNSRERLALFRDESAWQQIRYEYHGYICVDVPSAYIPVIDERKSDEVCYDPSEPTGGLTSLHFVGSSHTEDLPFIVRSSSEIRVKVFEVHAKDGGYDTCFTSLPNTKRGTGSTKIKIRQDVSNVQDSECHTDRGGGASCDFEVNLTSDGFLIFPGHANETQATTSMMVVAGQPNLAGNHRRDIRIDVTRNDLFVSVTATAKRELIALGSRPRGGGGLSDSAFWATVPLEGMVYTVVHDPPGGDSFAELASGTEVTIEYELVDTRAASAGGSLESKDAAGFAGSFEVGMNLGYTAEATTKIIEGEVEGDFGVISSVDRPEFSVTTSSDDGWDIKLTTQRVLRSSQDAALPGRAGDAIVGAGVEIVYVQSDVLDLSRKSADKYCLEQKSELSWYPRKPTSYVVIAHAIESQIIPNLKFLLTKASEGSIKEDNSLRPLSAGTDSTEMKQVNEDWKAYIQRKIDAWKRTLEWSSPIDKNDVGELIGTFTGSDSVIGEHVASNIQDFADEFHRDLSSKRGPAFELVEAWGQGVGVDFAQAGIAAVGTSLNTPAAALLDGIGLSIPGAYSSVKRLLPFIDEDSIAFAPDDETVPEEYGSMLTDGEGELFYSFGMNERARDSVSQGSGRARLRGGGDSTMGDEGSSLSRDDNERILASLAGGEAPIGLKNVNVDEDERGSILLTFTGGGHSVEFSFTSDEGLDDSSYGIEMEISGGFELGNSFEFSTKFDPGPTFKFEGEHKNAFSRSVGHERTFAWNKRGRVVSKYVLGDPEFGDKFVLSVGADLRFGTPVFATMGGRSKCPGELGTVFRESDVSLMIPLATKRAMNGLNPNQRAIFEIIIENKSPYREASEFALRVIDGLAESLADILAEARAAAEENPNDAVGVARTVKSKAQSTIAKDSPQVEKLIRDAETAATANPTDARDVVTAVLLVVNSAPREGTELADSQFTINGNKLSIGSYMPLKFINGDALTDQKRASQMFMNFGVEPGYATRDIRYMQLRLESLCEMDFSQLYRSPIAFTKDLDHMRWEMSCPRVQFDTATVASYLTSTVSTGTSSVLNLVVNNPDQYSLWPDDRERPSDALMNTRLKYVRLQYRPVTGGEWITAKDERSDERDKKFNLLCPHSRGNGCRFEWDTAGRFDKLLSGFKDGKYELRLKNFCTGADALADTSVHEYISDQKLLLTVDTVAPVITRTFGIQQYFGVKFAENIDCSNVNVYVEKRYNGCWKATAMSQVVDVTVPPYEIRCLNTTSTGTFSIKFRDHDVGQYMIKVRGIKDGAGIPAVTVDGWFKKCWRNTASAATGTVASARLSRAPTRANDAPSPFELSEPAAFSTVARLAVVLCAVVLCAGAFAVIRLASSVVSVSRRGSSSLDSTEARDRDERTELRTAPRASYGSIL